MNTNTKVNNKKNVNQRPALAHALPYPLSIVLYIVAVVVVARFLLCLLPSHRVDMGGYNFWSHYLVEHPFTDFYYDTGLHVVYGPVYMYMLFISGKLAAIFQVSDLTHEVFIKSWAVISDLAGAYFIYLIGSKNNRKTAGFWVAVLYALNPAIFINSSIWGQFDSLPATMTFAVLYCFMDKRKILAVVIYVASVLTKPQSIFLAPLVAYLYAFQGVDWKKLFSSKTFLPYFKSYFTKAYWTRFLIGCVASLATYMGLILPFFKASQEAAGKTGLWLKEFFLWFPQHTFKYVDDYPYPTGNGFNLWTLLGGQAPVDDRNTYIILSYATWGKLLFLLTAIFAVWFVTRMNYSGHSVYYAGFILGFGFFMFWTRMHERYLVPALIFMIVCIVWDKRLIVSSLLLSACVFWNQYYMYDMARRDEYWVRQYDSTAVVVALVSLVIFVYSIFYMARMMYQKPTIKSKLKAKR